MRTYRKALIICLTILTTAGIAQAKTKLEQARELAKIGELTRADHLIQEYYLEVPTNPERHFSAALLYIEMTWYANARERFAVILEKLKGGPKWRQRISDAWKEAAYQELQQGSIERANEFLDSSMQVDPDNPTLAKDFVTRGKVYLAQGRSGRARADLLFWKAYQFKSNYGKELAELWFNEAAAAGDADCAELYQLTWRYSQHRKKDIVDRLVRVAKARAGEERMAVLRNIQYFVSDAEYWNIFGAEMQGYIGCWAGEGHQDNASNWTIEVCVRYFAPGPCATIKYPSLNCGGEWNCSDHLIGDAVSFVESIKYGRERCVDGGTVTLRPLSGGKQVEYSWESREVRVKATAILDKREAPATSK